MIGCGFGEARTILTYSNVLRAQRGSCTWPSFDLSSSAGLGLHLKITCNVLCGGLSDIPCCCWTCLPWWTWALPTDGDYRAGWKPLTCLNTISYMNLTLFRMKYGGLLEVGCILFVGYQNSHQPHSFRCIRQLFIKCILEPHLASSLSCVEVFYMV